MTVTSPHPVAVGDFDPPGGGLRGRVVAGIALTGLAQVVRLGLQIVSVVLLSRLLAPAQFGLVAMAAPIVAFAALFQDLGFTQAVVQKRSLTQDEVSGLFWISLGTGAGLAGLLAVISPWVARLYHEPAAGLLTAAMGVNLVLGGVGALPSALLNRRMRFGALALIDTAGALGGLLAAVGGALLCRDVWALYAGGVLAAAIPAAGCWLVAGWRPSWPRRRSGVGGALRFGANVTGFNAANFFARNLDNVLIGQAWGQQALGLYDRAYKLLLFPLQQINGPVARVMLPALARLADDPERYRRAYLRTLGQMLLVTFPGIAFLVGTSHLLIPALLGPRWAGAAPIFAALGLASFAQTLNNPSGWLFVSQGRTREFLCWGLFGATTCVVGFVLGLPHGAFGVAAVYTAGEYLRTPLLWTYVTRRGPLRAGDVVRLARPHFCGAAASLAVVLAARTLPAAPPCLLLPLALTASYLTAALVVSRFPEGRTSLGHAWDQLQSIRRKLPGRGD